MSRRGAAAAALLLAACAPGRPFDEVITFVDHAPAYSPIEVSSFAAAGPLVSLRGPLPGGAAPEAVAAALRMPGFFPQNPFALAPDPAPAERQTRFVLVFGPGGVNPDAICRGEAQGGGGAPGLSVAAAFCRGPAPFGWGRLDHARPLTPDDPAFGRAMTRLLADVAPRSHPNDPRRDGRDGCVLLCG